MLALSDEFLDEGVAKGFNEVVGLIAAIVEPAIRSAVEAMPEIAEIKEVATRRKKKKRVAAVEEGSSPRPRSQEETEGENDAGENDAEEAESRPRNSLRAIVAR